MKASAPMLTSPRSLEAQFPSGPWFFASQARPRSSASSLAAVISPSSWARAAGAQAVVTQMAISSSQEVGRYIADFGVRRLVAALRVFVGLNRAQTKTATRPDQFNKPKRGKDLRTNELPIFRRQ